MGGCLKIMPNNIPTTLTSNELDNGELRLPTKTGDLTGTAHVFYNCENCIINFVKPLNEFAMVSFIKTIFSAAIATTTMTLFSYIVSKKEKENFKEPKLLGDFVERTVPIHQKSSYPLGWFMHYLTGIAFAGIYRTLLNYKTIQPGMKDGAIYGFLAGGAGVLTWNTLFKTHPNPPQTDRKEFYAQLIVAHVIFGVTLSLFNGNKSIKCKSCNRTNCPVNRTAPRSCNS
jgi:hypothetical protein